MSTWVALIGVGVGSYLLRVVPLLVLGRAPLSEDAERIVGHAGLAAITALVALSARGAAAGGAALATVAAVATGAVLAHRQAPMLHVVAAGGAMYAAARLGAAVVG